MFTGKAIIIATLNLQTVLSQQRRRPCKCFRIYAIAAIFRMLQPPVERVWEERDQLGTDEFT